MNYSQMFNRAIKNSETMFNSDAKLKKLCDEYLLDCNDSDTLPCKSGLYLFLGITRQKFYEYKQSTTNRNYIKYTKTIQKVFQVIQVVLVDQMVNKRNSMALALLKTEFGYMEEDRRQTLKVDRESNRIKVLVGGENQGDNKIE